MRKMTIYIVAMLFLTASTAWADGFTVERAVNLGQLDSWADISQFQWQEIDHGIQDNREEMDALKTLFKDPAPKDTVGFYNQIYTARDNQYIVLRLDKAQGNRPFHMRVTAIRNTDDPSKNSSQVFLVLSGKIRCLILSYVMKCVINLVLLHLVKMLLPYKHYITLLI